MCNEDDKTDTNTVAALRTSVQHGASYGLMLKEHNQTFPFRFDGPADDPVFYAGLRALATAAATRAHRDLPSPSGSAGAGAAETKTTPARLRVPVVQMALGGTIQENRDLIVAGISNAAARGVRLAVFPESALRGTDENQPALVAQAVAAIRQAARDDVETMIIADLAAMETAVRNARSRNADLIAFPARAIAETALDRLCAAARDHRITVVVGMEHHIAGRRRNSAFVIGPTAKSSRATINCRPPTRSSGVNDRRRCGFL